MLLFSKLRYPKKWLTIITIFFNMSREAPRTLYTMSENYQTGGASLNYSIHAIDHGSIVPLCKDDIAHCHQLEYQAIQTTKKSPISAINEAVDKAHSEYVMINIDGARMLSPGILDLAHKMTQIYDNAFIYTLAWHLGEQLQNIALAEGYNQAVEDKLLANCAWQKNGYHLFDISVLAASSIHGYLSPISESNCFIIKKKTWQDLGGYHPGFISPGGGLANLDIFKRVMNTAEITSICLLGEGTFHQFHGGVASNVSEQDHPMLIFQKEYQEIYGEDWICGPYEPIYYGSLPKAVRRFI